MQKVQFAIDNTSREVHQDDSDKTQILVKPHPLENQVKTILLTIAGGFSRSPHSISTTGPSYCSIELIPRSTVIGSNIVKGGPRRSHNLSIVNSEWTTVNSCVQSNVNIPLPDGM